MTPSIYGHVQEILDETTHSLIRLSETRTFGKLLVRDSVHRRTLYKYRGADHGLKSSAVVLEHPDLNDAVSDYIQARRFEIQPKHANVILEEPRRPKKLQMK